MKKNVGNFDAFLRIWGGLFLLGVGINRDSLGMLALGAGKVAEGVTRFCPCFYLMGISTNENKISQKTLPKETSNPDSVCETGLP